MNARNRLPIVVAVAVLVLSLFLIVGGLGRQEAAPNPPPVEPAAVNAVPSGSEPRLFRAPNVPLRPPRRDAGTPDAGGLEDAGAP